LSDGLAVAARLEARRFVLFAAGRRAVRFGDEIGVAASSGRDARLGSSSHGDGNW
jgi:hypothetical protein